jgi:DNA-binding MarR family transcriptional regulator
MERKGYYAIIPANVRYSNIPASAKLLYGEITALSNQEGYCWATNNYFAKLYGVTKGTVSVWIQKLKKEGFITIEVQRNELKQVVKRKVSIVKKNDRGIMEMNEDNIKNKNIKKENILLGLSKRLNTLTKEVMGSDCTIEMGKNFLEYWTELNKSQTKMRFEMEKTWDTKRRLGRWEQNQKNWGSGKGKFATKTQEALTTWQAARNIIENENKRN